MNINETTNKYLTEDRNLNLLEDITEKHMKNMVKEIQKKVNLDGYAGTDKWIQVEKSMNDIIDNYIVLMADDS